MRKISPTIKEIAKAIGKSSATVSRALRDSSLVNPKLRRAIQEKAKAMGYRVDPRLSELFCHLRKGQSHTQLDTLAYVLSTDYPDYVNHGRTVSEGQHLRQLEGTKDKAATLGFDVEVFHLGDYQFKGEKLGKTLWNRGIRGVIVSMLEPRDSALHFDWSHFSAISTGFRLFEPTLHRVSHHHFHGMRIAYRKLRQLGYRKIGFLGSPQGHIASDFAARASYLHECRANGPKASPFEITLASYVPKEIDTWIRRHRLDAIIYSPIFGAPNSLLCLLQELGYNVPEEIALASLGLSVFDGSLAGIDQQPAVLGEAAATLIAGLISQNATGIPRHPIIHYLEGEWREGRTARDRAQ